MKAIRMFYRRLNFNSTSSQRSKCESSLMHSLRLRNKAHNKMQWREELADENKIWVADQYYPLSSFTDDDKQELLYHIAPKTPVINKRKHQSNRRKYKLKIKKSVNAEYEKGNTMAAEFLEDILAIEDSQHISYSKIEAFKALKMTRKKQRVKMLETYIEAHNCLGNKSYSDNNVYVQEGLFKFPVQWGIDTSIVTKHDYIDVVKSFLDKHFSDYPIECIVCHHDEREIDEDLGAHSHYFLSGRNKKTGTYDLHKFQVKVVNEYIKKEGELFDKLPSDSKLNRKQSQVFGEYFQRMFYEHVNETLLLRKGFKAVIADETERKSEERKKINREAKLPKSLRSHNLSTRSKELALKRLRKLQEKITEQQERLSSVGENIAAKKALLNSKVNQLQEAAELLDYFTKQAKEYSEVVKQQEIKFHDLLDKTERMNPQLSNEIADICKKIYLSIATRDNGLDRKAAAYIEQVLTAYQGLIPSSLNDICIAAAKILNDELLISGLQTISEKAITTDNESTY